MRNAVLLKPDPRTAVCGGFSIARLFEGLSAAVISSSVGRAMAIGERLRFGLHINDQTVNDEVVNPFGGVGASGNGTGIGGPTNWEEFTQWQWMTVKGVAPCDPL